jgi:TetR/AcrR family transcriptional repressor of mexJK operon
MSGKNRINKKYLDILDAATDLFLEQGYQESSITKLLNSFGGSRETIYRHFKSKEELFAAVLDHQIKDYLDFMLSLDIKTDNLRQGLLEWSNSLVSVVTSERYIKLRRLVISEVGSKPEIGQLYYEHTFMKGTSAITDFLIKQQHKNRLKAIDCKQMTYYLVGMLLYQVMHARILNLSSQPTREEISRMTTRVIDDFITAFGTN